MKIDVSDKKHAKLVNFIKTRFTYSEKVISGRYSKWRENERNYRAYIDLTTTAKSRKTKADPEADYPGTVPIVVPIGLAGVQTIIAYLLAVFCGRRPVIDVVGRGPEDVKPGESIQSVLDYQFHHSTVRGILKWYFWWQDALVYGFGVLGNFWTRDVAKTIKMQDFNLPIIGKLFGRRVEQETIEYEGNTFRNFDPWLCFPDPRVPISELQKGEFFGVKFREGLFNLTGDPDYFNLSEVPKTPTKSVERLSDRDRILGLTDPELHVDREGIGYTEHKELWAKIIPRDLELGDGSDPKMWVMTLANDSTIIRCNEMDYLHNKFPFLTTEFLPDAHQFISHAFIEAIDGLQGHLSWLLNTHMRAVRESISGMNFIDPSRYIMTDFDDPRPGKRVRLAPEYWGTSPGDGFFNISIPDATANYMTDGKIILDLIQRVSAITDNLMGIPAAGRRTALEMGGVQSAAMGRLRAIAEVMSVEGVIPLAKQMVANTQQLLSEEKYYRIVGRKAKETGMPPSELVKPNDILGEFDYPVADGTYPLDKYRMADVWREILIGIGKSEVLQQRIDVFSVFKRLCEALGVKNIEDFEVKVQGPEQIDKQVQAGNYAPAEGDLSGILGPNA